MDVLLLSIEDDVAVVSVDVMLPRDSERFAEQVAQLAGMPVRWCVVEAIPLADAGPGDVADQLAEPGDLPTATWKTAEP